MSTRSFPWIGAVLVVATLCASPWLWTAYQRSRVSAFQNTLVGITEDEVQARYGAPVRTFPGHYGNPPLDYTQRFGTTRSAVHERLGGELYVCYEQRDGIWFVVRSDFLPSGSAF